MIELKKYTKFHSLGYIIEIYNNGEQQEIVYGNREIKPKAKKCTKNTLYDIASLTKVYTATLVYMAFEEGILDINDDVKSIDNRFFNLDNVKVVDLLSHSKEIWTKGYLGDAKSKNEFCKILFTAFVKDNNPTYVDINYIILSTLLEKIYNNSFDKILEEKIFKKLHLKKTTINPTGSNIASNNYENLNNEIIDYITPGLIHDTKGRVAKSFGIITGHASIFTIGKELLEFLKSFLDNTLLSKETIALMLKHRDRNQENYEMLKKLVSGNNINKMYEEAFKANPSIRTKLRTYNNMGTRYRNDINALNDIPEKCSENTIAFSGYTGPSFIIDFDKKIIVIIMCNVVHNSKLNRYERKKYTDLIMNDICNKIIDA